MSEPFVVLDNQEYYVGDWIIDNRVAEVATPGTVDSLELKEDGAIYIWMRSPLLEYYSIPLSSFIERIQTGVFEKMAKPKFNVGQVFRNRFTEKSLEIMDVPRMRNQENGEYVYYVLTFSPTFGHNHDVRKESEIVHFYVSEGVVEV